MIPGLTKELIAEMIAGLPQQYQVMLHLLLIQYLDIKQEHIKHMTADRPDPRMQLGVPSTSPPLSKHAIESVAGRADQYRQQARQKRERLWLQIECAKKQMALSDVICQVAENLMASRFGLDAATIQELKKQARSSIPKPQLRALERQWDKDEISQEDYQRTRLPIEYQTQLRRLERERRRLDTGRRELDMAQSGPLQDHEIAHIWGIPMSSLAARKVKALHQYLVNLQKALEASKALPATDPSAPPIDLWKETFATLAASPIERSIAVYDGMEGSEAALIDKLTAFATGALPEDAETRFWQIVSRDYSPNAVEGQGKRQSLFALQRLLAVVSDIDLSPETVEENLLAKITPKPKDLPVEEEVPTAVPQLGDMAEHVLRSFQGEERS